MDAHVILINGAQPIEPSPLDDGRNQRLCPANRRPSTTLDMCDLDEIHLLNQSAESNVMLDNDAQPGLPVDGCNKNAPTTLSACALDEINLLDRSMESVSSRSSGIGHTDEIRLLMGSLAHVSTGGLAPPPTGETLHPTLVADNTTSMTGSAHFTLVNGFGKAKEPRRPPEKRGCCGCKPIAALVILMTMLMALIVSSLVFFTEYPHMGATVQ